MMARMRVYEKLSWVHTELEDIFFFLKRELLILRDFELRIFRLALVLIFGGKFRKNGTYFKGTQSNWCLIGPFDPFLEPYGFLD